MASAKSSGHPGHYPLDPCAVIHTVDQSHPLHPCSFPGFLVLFLYRLLFVILPCMVCSSLKKFFLRIPLLIIISSLYIIHEQTHPHPMLQLFPPSKSHFYSLAQTSFLRPMSIFQAASQIFWLIMFHENLKLSKCIE